MNANDVLDVLIDLILKRGKPKFIRSDNGPGTVPGPSNVSMNQPEGAFCSGVGSNAHRFRDLVH